MIHEEHKSKTFWKMIREQTYASGMWWYVLKCRWWIKLSSADRYIDHEHVSESWCRTHPDYTG
jgi:hypothetical protein